MIDGTITEPVAAAPSFAFIKIVVSDLDRAVGFYEKVLSREATGTFERPGFVEKVLPSPVGQTGPSIILYHSTDDREIRVGNGWGPIGFRVDDVDAIYRKALDHGGQPSREPSDIGGLRIAFVLDPEGHEIEFISRD